MSTTIAPSEFDARPLHVLGVRLAHPVERVRGGELLVTVDVQFSDGEMIMSVPGVAAPNGDHVVAIREAVGVAVEDAKMRFLFLRNMPAQNVAALRDAVISLAKQTGGFVISNKRLEKMDDTADRLEGVATEEMAAKVFEMCEVIAVLPIDILEEGWTLAAGIALTTTLESMTKAHEVKAVTIRSAK